MPPSTTSSHTMSAELRPVWGRASIEFSIFTATAGRWATDVVATPVSGQTTGGGAGVGVGVGAALVAGAATFFGGDEEQAPMTSTAIVRSTPTSRRGVTTRRRARALPVRARPVRARWVRARWVPRAEALRVVARRAGARRP